MAEQTYTLAELEKQVHHTLGKAVNTQLTSEAQIVNDALQELCKEYPWSWLLRKAMLDTDGSSVVSALPSDFGGVHLLHVTGNGTSTPIALDEVKPIRPNQPEGSIGTYRYFIENTPQGTGTGGPVMTLNIIGPTPPASTTGWLTLIYFRTMPEMTSVSAPPDIPAGFHTLLKQLVRARAALENHHESADMENAKYQAMLASGIARDKGERSNIGSTDRPAA